MTRLNYKGGRGRCGAGGGAWSRIWEKEETMNNMILHMLYHILKDACILEVLIVIAILLWLFNWLSVYST